MTGQEVQVLEDIVGGGFAIGNGHPEEPYIALLRGVDPEDVLQQIKMAESRAFDAGWIASEKCYASFLAQRIRDAERAAERRVHADYRQARRARRFQNIACAAILIVMGAALLYLSGGQS